MGTTADKLAYLSATKDAIKNAIVAKGVDVPDGTPFRQYADKVEEIESGGLPYIEVFPDSFYPPDSDICQVVISGGSNDGKILVLSSTTIFNEDGNCSFSSKLDGHYYYMSWSRNQVSLNSDDGLNAFLYIDSGNVEIESGTVSVPSLVLRYYVKS